MSHLQRWHSACGTQRSRSLSLPADIPQSSTQSSSTAAYSFRVNNHARRVTLGERNKDVDHQSIVCRPDCSLPASVVLRSRRLTSKQASGHSPLTTIAQPFVHLQLTPTLKAHTSTLSAQEVQNATLGGVQQGPDDGLSCPWVKKKHCTQ